MTAPSQSYRRVFYDLRPAKQVERRMVIDALQLLAEGGFRIRDYQYTGMGSIYFVDFQLFHRFLGIKRLLSVEYDGTIEKRVRFNKPFADIAVAMAPIGDVLPTLSKDIRHIVWLDYDAKVSSSILQDVVLAGQTLSVGSFVFVTVDVEHPPGDTPKDWQRYYETQATDYVPFEADIPAFTESSLPGLNAQILTNALLQGVAGRPEVKYLPILSFAYADGHTMLTVGGLIAGETEEKKLVSSGVAALPFARLKTEAEPFRIRVPRLTRKERITLDAHMPCADGWSPKEFELESGDIEDYRSVYRYYPIYGELLI